MTTFVCPGCGDRQEALASTMSHRCPRRQLKVTAYAPIESPTPIELAVQEAGDEALARRLLARQGKNATSVACGCPRRVRAFPATLAAGPITCGVCGGDFQ